MGATVNQSSSATPHDSSAWSRPGGCKRSVGHAAMARTNMPQVQKPSSESNKPGSIHAEAVAIVGISSSRAENRRGLNEEEEEEVNVLHSREDQSNAIERYETKRTNDAIVQKYRL